MSPSDCLPERDVTCSGSGRLVLAPAPFGLDLGWTDVTVSTGGAGLGELKAEEVVAVAVVELEAGGVGLLLLLLAEVSLRLSSAQSGLGK